MKNTRNMACGLGFLFIRAYEKSQMLYDVMSIRGYSGKLGAEKGGSAGLRPTRPAVSPGCRCISAGGGNFEKGANFRRRALYNHFYSFSFFYRNGGLQVLEEIVRISCIRHIYPDSTEVYLCGLDFVVRKGERVVIIGPNGSGKTTLLYPYSGTSDAE